MSQIGIRKKQRHHYLPAFIAISIVGIYILRLFYLQILSPEYKAKALNNAFYEKVIYPDRGVIYDRKGRLVVYNEPAYDLLVVVKEVVDLDTMALCSLLQIDREALDKRFANVKDRKLNPGYSPHVPQLLWGRLSAQEAGRFQEQLYKFPGFSMRPHSVRSVAYPNAALVLGYMGETNAMELECDSSLMLGEYVGKSGVEKQYDSVLRGTKGVEVLLRDSRGRIKGSYNNGEYDRPEKQGNNIYLSLDMELQALGESLMRGKRGAIVMIEPATGQVLCLVSSPTYDPALLSGRLMGKNHKLLEEIPGKPLFNRAIQGTYPPGSTFKVAHAGVLLQEGVISPHTQYTCHHGYPRMRNKPACHSHASPLSVEYSIATSCNAFYCWGLHYFLDDRRRYPSVQEAFEAWKNSMVRLGMGYRLDVDLPGEKRGYLPNSQVYDKVYKRRWNSSTIISNSIGQGEILLTPLQMCNVAAIVANRGFYYKPHVVKQIENGSLDTLYTTMRDSGVRQEYWEIVASGMAKAVTGGTCRVANFAPGEIEVCGKTGTAENPRGKDHSAFIGFAPRYNPKVCIAVYVENGGFGAVYGVPIGRVMMEYYLRDGVLSEATRSIANRIRNQSIHYLDARKQR